MRIAVCDDDEQESAFLSRMIKEYQLSRGVSVDCLFFHNGTDFLCNGKGGEYDLVLLDVLMPGINGMQVAQELRELDKNVKIIFISSSPEFAVESYRVGAYHYLLKPVDKDLFFQLLDRIRSELSTLEEQGFVLKSREGVVGISFTRLEYVEVINKTVNFHLADGVVYETFAALADFEETLLSRPEFLKTHRSYIINLGYIQAINGNVVVTKNGYQIPISRQRRNQVRDSYIHFLKRTEENDAASDGQESISFKKAERPAGPWKILLVDDDPGDRAFWADVLRQHGCMVQQAENGEDALKFVETESYDCVLLDVMIPGEDGFSTCERLRKMVNTPIIFLSSFTEADRQLKGFAVGGIDYITKNTPAELFWAKVETRIKLTMSDRTRFCYGALLLDPAKRRALIEEKELFLTPLEFDILLHLSEYAGHIISPEELFHMVWGGQPWDGGQLIQTHMSRLRRKLEKAYDKHCFIETVWGHGYRFVPEKD